MHIKGLTPQVRMGLHLGEMVMLPFPHLIHSPTVVLNSGSFVSKHLVMGRRAGSLLKLEASILRTAMSFAGVCLPRSIPHWIYSGVQCALFIHIQSHAYSELGPTEQYRPWIATSVQKRKIWEKALFSSHWHSLQPFRLQLLGIKPHGT